MKKLILLLVILPFVMMAQKKTVSPTWVESTISDSLTVERASTATVTDSLAADIAAIPALISDSLKNADSIVVRSLTVDNGILDGVTVKVVESLGGNSGLEVKEALVVRESEVGSTPSIGFATDGGQSDLVPPATMSSSWDWALPDKSGTIMMTSDTTSLSNRIDLNATKVVTDSLASDISDLVTVDDSLAADIKEIKTFSIIKTDPDAVTSFTLFRTKYQITIDSIFILTQGASATVDFNLSYGTNRTSGTDIFSADETADNITVGETISSFDTNVIPISNMFWLSISAITNSPTEFMCVIYYH